MAKQITHAFVVTSAINSKFGVFSPAERLQQTIDTITSIKSKLPNAKIFIMECCGTPTTVEQANQLKAVSDVFVDYSHDADVQDMYDSDNWDIVKNGTEIMCFGNMLEKLKEDNHFAGVDRIHKMSGRYILNDLFHPSMYEHPDILNKIVIGPKHQSQFPIEVTTVPLQYMARLWSWPVALLDDVNQIYHDSFMFFAERVAVGGYVDIEHVLYKFLEPSMVCEIQNLGVEGCIAPNGTAIKN